MKRHALIAIMAALPLCAQAEDMIFEGNVSSGCDVVPTQAGSLTFSSSSAFSTATENQAQATVTNIMANAFRLSIANPTSWSSKPNDYTGTPSFSVTANISGVNNQPLYPGTPTTLMYSGTDTVKVGLSGYDYSTSGFTAGAYRAVVVLTCDPI